MKLFEYILRFLASQIILVSSLIVLSTPVNASENLAVFAGGCFWCMEHDFEELRGVSSVESGYSGGTIPNPTYTNHTGHQEVISVKYNTENIDYSELLRVYWRNVDPYDFGGQFCDRGDSYRPVIFTFGEKQAKKARESFEYAATELSSRPQDLQVEVKAATKFWIAEDYHQNFAERNTIKYNFYRYSCGRDKRLEEVWGENARQGKSWDKGND